MNMQEASWQVADLIEGCDSVFLRAEPEVPDFTISSPFKILIFSQRQKVELDVTPQNILSVIGLFDSTIFNKERIERLYVWNLKAICTYFRSLCPKFVIPRTSFLDLKVIEAFLGLRFNRPENLVEFVDRLKIVIKNKHWQRIYKIIHQPLMLKVLPSIESTPLLNQTTRKCEYPYYEIEGETNGRMNCLNKYAHSYLPHNMGPDVRENLKPPGYNKILSIADFRHCEVNVLQWLSNDEILKEIIDSGADLHNRIYEIVTGNPCDSDTKRKMSKLMFLPVMYGCGPKGLAVNLKLPENVGAELCNRIHSSFPTASRWLLDRQNEAKQGVVFDHFGRPRKFKNGESYQFRNTVVQSVAATMCQEKLIQLFNALEPGQLAFSVHDGYGVITDVQNAQQTYRAMKDTLESESELCPGLQMKAEVKFGPRLSKMKVLWKD